MRIKSSQQYWREACVQSGRFNRDIGLKTALHRADEFLDRLSNVTIGGTDLKAALMCRYIKNNEVCLDLAYNTLQSKFLKQNTKLQWGLDHDLPRMRDFVIQGTQCCFSQPALQVIKNVVCMSIHIDGYIQCSLTTHVLFVNVTVAIQYQTNN